METNNKIMEQIENLNKELEVCDENIQRTKDEINAKKRTLTELQTKKQNLEDKIKAKKLENLESIISNKLGMNIAELTGAINRGDILFDNSENGTSNAPVRKD